MQTRFLTLLVLFGIVAPAAGQGPRPQIGPPRVTVGHWRACLIITAANTSTIPTPNAECGEITISSDTFPDLGLYAARIGLRATHTLSLGRLFGHDSELWPRVGSITFGQRDSVTADSTTFYLQLGSVGGADNGSIVAYLSSAGPDLLQGTWAVSCYACQGATGTIVLKHKQ